MNDGVLEILNAPWTTVLTLAAGYAGYFVAHVGARDHHRQVDQAFRVIFYGFWGVFAYLAVRAYWGFGILPASLICMGVTVLLGAVWRRWVKGLVTWALRASRVSLSDDLPNAWMAIPDVGERVEAGQLGVILVDGVSLFCEDLARFSDQPNGPCVLGGQGDVLIYVTKVGRRNGAGEMVWTDVPSVIDDRGAAQITYVPRDQIARINLRRAWRK